MTLNYLFNLIVIWIFMPCPAVKEWQGASVPCISPAQMLHCKQCFGVPCITLAELLHLNNAFVAVESFHVIRPNLLGVRARTDPDLSSLVGTCYSCWNKLIIREWCKSETVPARPLERLTWNDSVRTRAETKWNRPSFESSDAQQKHIL